MKKNTLPAWKVVWATISFSPGYWIVNLLSMILLMIGFNIPGLAMREFFNLLTQSAQADFSLLTLMTFLLLGEVLRLGTIFGLLVTNVPFWIKSMAMLRRNLLKHILKRPGAQALPDSPGEATNRFRTDVFEIPLFALWINDILGLILFSAIALVIMFRIHATITLVAILPFLAVGVISSFASRKVEGYRRESRKHTGIVTGFIGEVFGAVQAIKVAYAEKSILEHFKALNQKRRAVAIKDVLFNEFLHSIFRNTATLGTGVILILAGQSMAQGTFTLGDFALFVFYLDFICDLTAFGGLLVARYRQIGVSVERMQRLMEGSEGEALIDRSPLTLKEEIDVVEKRTRIPLETLEVKDLRYRFPNSEKGVQNASFTLKRGSFTVITGVNGSGKTSLLRLILGLLPLKEGEILYNGSKVEDPGEFFVPPLCAYTSQIPRLFSETLKDNILLGIRDHATNIPKALHLAVLDQDVAGLEHGLGTLVGPKGVKLSGGQVQRAAAARMFVRNSELLVFDDLSSALDVETEKLLWERVFEQEGATCLVVSHRKPALKRADQILVMKDGAIHARGSLEELLETSAEFRKIWYGTQTKPPLHAVHA